jgi:hypothetical protein
MGLELHWTGKRCSRCRILDQGDVVEPLTGAYHHSKVNQLGLYGRLERLSDGSVAVEVARALEQALTISKGTYRASSPTTAGGHPSDSTTPMRCAQPMADQKLVRLQ